MRSLRFRFFVLTLLTTLLVLSGAHVVLSGLFQTHVYKQVNATLDNQINQLLARLQVMPDGLINLETLELSDPRWDKPYSGLYWQISPNQYTTDTTLLRSRSLWDTQLSWIEDTIKLGERHYHTMQGPQQEALRAVETVIGLESSPQIQWRLIVAQSTSSVDQAIQDFEGVLTGSMLVLLALIATAAGLQWRWGLAPLHTLVNDLKGLTAGQGLPSKQPYPNELQPLVKALNRVLEINTQMVESSKTQAGNLAHALKTPLAVMRNTLDQIPQAELREVMSSQIETAQKHIQWHLSKARAQAQFAVHSEAVEVLPSIAALVRVMQKLNPALTVNLIEGEGGTNALFDGEITILQDMVGNLLDNACRFAQSRVDLTVSADPELCITIDDDGPGIVPELRVRVLQRGLRLDESMPGSGLGLAIVVDLASLYGGHLLLEDSPLGGLRTRLMFALKVHNNS